MKHTVQGGDGTSFEASVHRGRIADVKEHVDHDLIDNSTPTFLGNGVTLRVPNYSMIATHEQKVRINLADGTKISIHIPGDCDATVGDEIAMILDHEGYIVGWVNFETRKCWQFAERRRILALAPLLQYKNPLMKVGGWSAYTFWFLFESAPIIAAGYVFGLGVLLLMLPTLTHSSFLSFLLSIFSLGFAALSVTLTTLMPGNARRRIQAVQRRLREIGQSLIDAHAPTPSPVAAPAAS